MVEPLVIPFVVVVRDALAAGATPRALADQDHALEAGVLDGTPEALRVGVQVELGDPRPVGLGADARDLHAAADQVNQDQHGEAGQAAWRPDSTVQQSAAASTSPWAARHSRQVVRFLRSGAGSRPRSLRTLAMGPRAT